MSEVLVGVDTRVLLTAGSMGGQAQEPAPAR